MRNTIISRIGLFLKGMAMGAADVVPGVSGGTIAFITGIYEELINSIKSVNGSTIKLLFTGGIVTFWKAINGNFLLPLFFGIGVSVLSLAKVLEALLSNYPVLVWSFFFGLIIASAIYVAKQIEKWNIAAVISIFTGAILAYFITVISPAETTNDWWFLILSGAVAICAMILPGISGSFILLLLGKYAFVISAVSNFDLQVIALVGIGAIIGLLSFANLLSWLLNKFRDITVAILGGFMIGSLNKIWPWKKVIETYTDSHGEIKPLIEQNVLPNLYQGDNMFVAAIVFMLIGFALIFIIEKIALKSTKG